MHNGFLGGFPRYKRQLLGLLRDDIADSIDGTTDSQHAFAVYLQCLSEVLSGGDLSAKPTWSQMARAMQAAVWRLAELSAEVAAAAAPAEWEQAEASAVHLTASQADVSPSPVMPDSAEASKDAEAPAPRDLSTLEAGMPSMLNFVVSDGDTVIASRVSLGEAANASLHFTVGSEWLPAQAGAGAYRMAQRDVRSRAVIIASERLTSAAQDWVSVPPQTVLVVTPSARVLILPLNDSAAWAEDGPLGPVQAS